MTLLMGLLVNLIVGAVGYVLGKRRPLAPRFEGRRFHSTEGYYGWFVAVCALVPAFVAYLLYYILRLTRVVPHAPWGISLLASVLAVGGAYLGYRGIQPSLRARNHVDRAIMGVLLAASLVSILTTIGIVLSVIFESVVFFRQVSVIDFLFGTKWNPDTAFLAGAGRAAEGAAKPEFGSVPLFAGTTAVTVIALLVAGPIGLLSAIFMSEYAPLSVRRWAKPILEILAGIPTVVYGFFAAVTISPLVVAWADKIGLAAEATNALSPGLVMGIMIIPFISSLSDDVITAVPNAMREGAYALGATSDEVIRKVLLPAALPGIVSAFLLAISRAVGETMIVVMAAGLRANLTWNPLEGMTTVTVRIVDALTGDQAFDSLETLSAFALGLVLLCMTLVLNVISAVVIRKYHEKYE